MKLELKESNSPFWLLGLSKGKSTLGSATNVPCYYKTIKKQKEIANQIINEPGIDEVYRITGIEWDNMKGSWNNKEAGSYIQNKGKLILSKDEITEGDYPKGVSREPLPKKGVKTYTSVATALEGKGDEKMKLELNEEKIVKEELTPVDDIPEDLQDRFFTTMGDGRPEMFKKFTKDELKLFADFVKQLPSNEITEFERSMVLVAISLAHGDDLTVECITESTQELIDKYEIDIDAIKADGYDLIVFRCPDCTKDLEEYNPYVYDNGNEIPLEKIKVIEVEEHDIDCENAEANMYAEPQNMTPIQLWKYSKIDVVKESNEYSKEFTTGDTVKFINPNDELSSETAMIVGYDEDGFYKVKWSDGNISSGLHDKNIELVTKSSLKEAIPVKAIVTGILYTVDNWETLKDIIETIKSTSSEIYNKCITIYNYLKDKGVDIKDAVKEISDSLVTESLTESKIVTPVGNPQTAGSFVNIDVDLDHMDVSDFIIRLAQAIRSEQTSVLEYVALRSANGITNEERANIDAIIEEEKNHMAAFTTMLYKQILTNHKQNVDKASEEFTLPSFGVEIFDNSKDGKLTESIEKVIEKISLKEAGIRMSDEYFIGNDTDGRMYHGLGKAMDVIKDTITTSGEQLVVQNVTIADLKKEDIKLEDKFNTIDELINELKTDTNYDEIAYHIHEYAKTNKARALELMDKLFELERNKSPKECVDAIIAELEKENEQYKTEDIKVSFDGETMSQTQWDVVVDVNYDADFQLQVANNLSAAIVSMNKETYSTEKYGIAEDKYSLAGDKFNFVILTFNGFTRNVDETFVAEVCDKLFAKATTYEYFIERT